MSRPAESAGLAKWLAGIAAGDPAILAAPRPGDDNIEESGLDVRTHAMVCLAALVAAGECGTAYDQHVATTLDRGVTPDEIAGVLVALIPTVGAARVTAAAPAICAAIERLAGDVPAGLGTKSAQPGYSKPNCLARRTASPRSPTPASPSHSGGDTAVLLTGDHGGGQAGG